MQESNNAFQVSMIMTMTILRVRVMIMTTII